LPEVYQENDTCYKMIQFLDEMYVDQISGYPWPQNKRTFENRLIIQHHNLKNILVAKSSSTTCIKFQFTF